MGKNSSNSAIRNNYWSPYLTGVLLGLVLLSTFYLMGWGLGVSRAVTKVTAYVLHIPFPDMVEKNIYFKDYFREEQPLKDWIVFEVSGMVIGGIVGAITGRRFSIRVERGPRINPARRFLFALLGGIIVGFATRLARGCTSGVALSGGATLALGAWAFVIGMFSGGYAIAFFVKRLWR
ncbi:MAG: YeeE/YedE thiosulfate transporter family protein [Nitrospirota bacterium]